MSGAAAPGGKASRARGAGAGGPGAATSHAPRWERLGPRGSAQWKVLGNRLETEDAPLKEKSQGGLNSATAGAIVCFALQPAPAFGGVIGAQGANNGRFCLVPSLDST